MCKFKLFQEVKNNTESNPCTRDARDDYHPIEPQQTKASAVNFQFTFPVRLLYGPIYYFFFVWPVDQHSDLKFITIIQFQSNFFPLSKFSNRLLITYVKGSALPNVSFILAGKNVCCVLVNQNQSVVETFRVFLYKNQSLVETFVEFMYQNQSLVETFVVCSCSTTNH